MPTKEEILNSKKSHDLHIRQHIVGVVAPVLSAMEEYAKQEAKEFNFFYINNKMKYLGWDFKDIYKEYQLSKL